MENKYLPESYKISTETRLMLKQKIPGLKINTLREGGSAIRAGTLEVKVLSDEILAPGMPSEAVLSSSDLDDQIAGKKIYE